MHPEGNPLKGVALVVAATLLFAGGDTLGKHLSMLYAEPLILSARYISSPCGRATASRSGGHSARASSCCAAFSLPLPRSRCFSRSG